MQARDTCRLLLNCSSVPPTFKEIAEGLESANISEKRDTLKKIIRLHISGESVNSTVLSVIKFCVPCGDHELKKLMFLLWELIDKTDGDGKLLPEMLLLISSWRVDLQHPNEYIRGATLRFLCSVQERDLLEPLVPCIVDCSRHQHPYVSRAAVHTLACIFRKHSSLVSGIEPVLENLLTDHDGSVQCRAFQLLSEMNPNWLTNLLQSVASGTPSSIIPRDVTPANVSFWNTVLRVLGSQLRNNAGLRAPGAYLLSYLLQIRNMDPSVQFSCAQLLPRISGSESAMQSAAEIYSDLMATHEDLSVKQVVLKELEKFKSLPPHCMSHAMTTMIRCLEGTTLPYEIRSRLLKFIVFWISENSANQLLTCLLYEIDCLENRMLETTESEQEAYLEYIAHVIEQILRQFPEKVAQEFVRFATKKVNLNVGRYFTHLLTVALKSISDQDRDNYIRELLSQVLVCNGQPTGRQVLNTLRAFVQPKHASQVCDAVEKIAQNLSDCEMERNRSIDEIGPTVSCLASLVGQLLSDVMSLSNEQVEENDALLLRACLEKLYILVAGRPALFDSDSANQVVFLRRLHMDSALNSSGTGLHLLSLPMSNCLPEENAIVVRPSETSVDVPLSYSMLPHPSVSREMGTRKTEDEELALAVSGADNTSDTLPLLDAMQQGIHSSQGVLHALTGFGEPLYVECAVSTKTPVVTFVFLIVNQTSSPMLNLKLGLSARTSAQKSEAVSFIEKFSPCNVSPGDFTTVRATLKIKSTQEIIVFPEVRYEIQAGTTSSNTHTLLEISVDPTDHLEMMQLPCRPEAITELWTKERHQVVSKFQKHFKGNDWHCCEKLNLKDGKSLCAESDTTSIQCTVSASRTLFNDIVLTHLCLSKDGEIFSGNLKVKCSSEGVATSLSNRFVESLTTGTAA